MVHTIPRGSWGARHPDGFRDRPMPVREFWLHHSVTVAPDLVPPFSDDDAAVRTLESIGQSRFGGGISYTFPVTPVGRLYQGHSLHRQGAHTYGHNTVGAAFCLIGNYDVMAPTQAQKVAIAEKMVELHRAGKATRHTLNGGHRDTGFSTACPGGKAHAAIPEINRMAEQIWKGQRPTTGSGPTDTWTPTGKMSTKQVQDLLGLKQDGIYGDTTAAAVKELQKELGLTADGLWGPATEREVMRLEEKVDKVATDGKRILTQNRQILEALEALRSAGGFDPSMRIALTDPTAESIGWGNRKTKTMSVGGLMQTTMRLAAENAQGIKRTREEIAKIADAENEQRG